MTTRLTSTDRFLTVSNLLSISRALLAIPFVFVMLPSGQTNRMWGGLIMAIAALTDKLDGVFARRYHEVTEWGKILDPLADKIAVAVAAIVLLKLDAISLWFVIAILARDLLIFAGGMYLKRRQGVVLQSNETGKWAVGIIALTLFLMVVGIRSIVTDVLITATVILLIVSLSFYLVRFAEEMKKPVG